MEKEKKNATKRMPLTEIAKKYPRKKEEPKKKGLIGLLLSVPFKFTGAMLGIDKETISSYSKSSKNYKRPIERHHMYGSPEAYRREYRFDPSEAYIRRIQEKAYLDMIDGKGDPEPHDCHCDHDER